MAYTHTGDYDNAYGTVNNALAKGLNDSELLHEVMLGIYLQKGDQHGAREYIRSLADKKDLEYLKKKFPDMFSDEPKETKITVDENGNTGGNIASNGLIAEKDGWVYMIKDIAPQMRGGSLYKMRSDGSEKIMLTDEATGFINVVGDLIYYQNGADNLNIYKIHTDGTECTKLNNDESWNINVAGGWIYYNNYSDNSSIYKVRTDGTENIKLSESKEPIYVVNGWIYGGLWKMRTDGTGSIVYGKDDAYYINVLDGWVYYSNMDDDNNIYKMRTDGTGRTKLCDDCSYFLNVWDGWIYYWKGPGEDGDLYKITKAEG